MDDDIITLQTCRFCGNRIRPCSKYCIYSGWVHMYVERHGCDDMEWFWSQFPTLRGQYQKVKHYAYPLRILRSTQMRMHRDNTRNGENTRRQELGTVLQQTSSALTDSQDIQERDRNVEGS